MHRRFNYLLNHRERAQHRPVAAPTSLASGSRRPERGPWSLDTGDCPALSRSVTTRARICAHEQVEAAFDDVFEALSTLPTFVGAQVPGAKPRPDFRHRDMARLPVHVEGHDASLVVFRLVGGRQAPITEIAVVTTVESGAELPASAGRRFIEHLTRALESELRAESGQPRSHAARPQERGRPCMSVRAS